MSEAFARVPRERFVGPGPWLILDDGAYVKSSRADPAILYDDVVIALMPDKRINNGQPTLHARCLSAAGIQPGQNVLHVGCGSGYYTALLSTLVTETGSVEAWDVEPELFARARANLEGFSNASVRLGDATQAMFTPKDLIYVCAGCTAPVLSWVGALADGGRLLFPLTPGWDYGGMLMITRDRSHFAARFICRCSFIPSIGASDPDAAATLREAFSAHGLESVKSLRLGSGPPGPDTWLAGDGWWLSRATPSTLQ